MQSSENHKKEEKKKKLSLMTALTDTVIVGCVICNWTKYKKDNLVCIYAVNYMQLVPFVSIEWNATPPIQEYLLLVY